MSSLTLCVGGRASVGFVDVPPPAARLLRARFGTMAQGLSRLAPPVTVRFSPPPVPRSSLVLTTAGVRVAADDGRRLFLLDQDGRRAQLPASANDEVLLVDPAIDARPYRTLHQLAERLLEWQVERQAMVALKGAAAVLPQGAVGLVGFAGSGKSSILLAMLDEATAYLAEERLVLSGPRTVASWPAPIRLLLGRRYRLPSHVEEAMSAQTRLALRLAGAATAGPGPCRAVVSRALRDRWVAIEPADAFPALHRPAEARLDALVFLLPSAGGGLRMEALSPQDVVTSVTHHVAYLRDVSLFALRAIVGMALPRLTPWVLDVPLDERLARLPSLLDGVQGWGARVPPGTPAGAVADAIRAALVSDGPA